jgi:hypothetical protein
VLGLGEARVPSSGIGRSPHEMNFVYAHVGALNRVLEYAEQSKEIGNGGAVAIAAFWDPRLLCGRPSASRRWCARSASSTTGAPLVGPISATPRAATISSAIDRGRRAFSFTAYSQSGDEETIPAVIWNGSDAAHSRPNAVAASLGLRERTASGGIRPKFSSDLAA